MKTDFLDNVGLITGAGSGIGLEIARQLAAQGAVVIVNDINSDLLEMAVRSITKSGGRAYACVGDAAEIRTIEGMVSYAVMHFDRLDLVIANAGITTFGDFLEYAESDFQKLVQLNLGGSFFLAQRSAKVMIDRNTSGRILFMSSVTGHQAHPQLAAYGMTKAALEMLAKGLSVELASYGITVNAIAPGATITDRTLDLSLEYQSTWERITPTGRVCTVADIAHAALFLLHPHSSQITGQSLIVDGGWTSVSPPPG